mmetsp:Transcript_18874/g.33752  ORF Transcript_18874/g.33752 Transcript_18874/m.33752 type:complete len:156 (+) Transcript_18874:89-556(+)
MPTSEHEQGYWARKRGKKRAMKRRLLQQSKLVAKRRKAWKENQKKSTPRCHPHQATPRRWSHRQRARAVERKRLNDALAAQGRAPEEAPARDYARLDQKMTLTLIMAARNEKKKAEDLIVENEQKKRERMTRRHNGPKTRREVESSPAALNSMLQ